MNLASYQNLYKGNSQLFELKKWEQMKNKKKDSMEMLHTPNLEWARPRARRSKNKKERVDYLRGGKRNHPTNQYLKLQSIMPHKAKPEARNPAKATQTTTTKQTISPKLAC